MSTASLGRRYRRYKQHYMHVNPGMFFMLDSLIVLGKLLVFALGAFLVYKLVMQL